MDRLVMKITRDELLGRRGGANTAKRPTVFVAYRMNAPSSIQFREEIQKALELHGHVSVLDGRVDDGVFWAPEVRKRLSKSQLVIADVTGPSKEVIFELGVAGGKPLLPVVESNDHRNRLPQWLTAIQMSIFSGPGTPRIAERAWVRLSSPGGRGTHRPPPVPGNVIWLQEEDSDWCNSLFNRFDSMCGERDLTVKRVYPGDLTSTEDLYVALRAWLIVGCLDGGHQDYATHYFAGDIVSRQSCGSGSGSGERIKRAMILLAKNGDTLTALTADSVNRVTNSLVAGVTPGNLFEQVQPHFNRHRRWLVGGRK